MYYESYSSVAFPKLFIFKFIYFNYNSQRILEIFKILLITLFIFIDLIIFLTTNFIISDAKYLVKQNKICKTNNVHDSSAT